MKARQKIHCNTEEHLMWKITGPKKNSDDKDHENAVSIQPQQQSYYYLVTPKGSSLKGFPSCQGLFMMDPSEKDDQVQWY